MKLEIKTWLVDIERSINEIYSFLPKKRNYIEFEKDLKTKKAFARSLEIIGEAAKAVPDEIRIKYPQIEWRAMAGMRDKLIHHYFGLDTSIGYCQKPG